MIPVPGESSRFAYELTGWIHLKELIFENIHSYHVMELALHVGRLSEEAVPLETCFLVGSLSSLIIRCCQQVDAIQTKHMKPYPEHHPGRISSIALSKVNT